jgi:hypothetical protein
MNVDHLGVAQFLQVLFHTALVPQIIETITSSIVLIVGQFFGDRAGVEDALRGELQRRERLPVTLELDNPAPAEAGTPIATVVRLARYVILDVTQLHPGGYMRMSYYPLLDWDRAHLWRSYEASKRESYKRWASIIADVPSVPVVPLLQQGKKSRKLYDYIKRYPWVLPPVQYELADPCSARMDELVIAPAEAKAAEIRKVLSGTPH